MDPPLTFSFNGPGPSDMVCGSKGVQGGLAKGHGEIILNHNRVLGVMVSARLECTSDHKEECLWTRKIPLFSTQLLMTFLWADVLTQTDEDQKASQSSYPDNANVCLCLHDPRSHKTLSTHWKSFCQDLLLLHLHYPQAQHPQGLAASGPQEHVGASAGSQTGAVYGQPEDTHPPLGQ